MAQRERAMDPVETRSKTHISMSQHFLSKADIHFEVNQIIGLILRGGFFEDACIHAGLCGEAATFGLLRQVRR